MRALIFGTIALTLAVVSGDGGARASEPALRIGFLTDVNGPHTASDGPASVDAARMAIADFGGSVLGRRVEIVVGDHRNKADVGSALARRWIDTENVDVVMDVNNSAVALAVSDIVRERKRILLVTSAASSDLTGRNCSPYLVHWLPDTYSLAYNAGEAITGDGHRDWYLIVADYAYGHTMQSAAERGIAAAGGRVAGVVRYPLGSPDFSSLLLRAQGSGAAVLGFANAAQDLINSMKQFGEFQVAMKPVAFGLYILDVPAVGQKQMQGLRFVDAFYWDMNEASRAWSKRFMARNGHAPTTPQGDAYRSVAHYLKAVRAAGTTDADAVMAKMKEMPIEDATGTKGYVRADGRVIRDMTLYEIKGPTESTSEWDLYRSLRVIPGDRAYRPLSEGGCPFVRS